MRTWLEYVAAWLPCAAAAIVTLHVACILGSDRTKEMGLPKWDFTASWASNLTIVSSAVSFGLLTTVLANSHTYLLDSDAYKYLVFFFPLLVALAPIIYNFLREVDLSTNNPPQMTLRGRASTFLLACFFTIWGTAGQMLLQSGVIFELYQTAHYLGLEVMIALEVIFAAMFIALLIYADRTMFGSVKIQPTLTAQRRIQAAIEDAQTQGWPLL